MQYLCPILHQDTEVTIKLIPREELIFTAATSLDNPSTLMTVAEGVIDVQTYGKDEIEAFFKLLDENITEATFDQLLGWMLKSVLAETTAALDSPADQKPQDQRFLKRIIRACKVLLRDVVIERGF
jgi:hypothetical protein